MDEYDDEDDVPLGENFTAADLNEFGEFRVVDHFHTALAVDAGAGEDSDEEDDVIRETDSLLIVAHTEDDHSYLEVQILDEHANFPTLLRA